LEFKVHFQHTNGYIRDERSGMVSYRYQVKEGQRYINLNPGRLFVQQPSKKRKGIKRLIEIITLAPTTGGDNYHTARQNQTKYHKKHACLIRKCI